jgi:hypothetical protein
MKNKLYFNRISLLVSFILVSFLLSMLFSLINSEIITIILLILTFINLIILALILFKNFKLFSFKFKNYKATYYSFYVIIYIFIFLLIISASLSISLIFDARFKLLFIISLFNFFEFYYLIFSLKKPLYNIKSVYAIDEDKKEINEYIKLFKEKYNIKQTVFITLSYEKTINVINYKNSIIFEVYLNYILLLDDLELYDFFDNLFYIYKHEHFNIVCYKYYNLLIELFNSKNLIITFLKRVIKFKKDIDYESSYQEEIIYLFNVGLNKDLTHYNMIGKIRLFNNYVNRLDIRYDISDNEEPFCYYTDELYSFIDIYKNNSEYFISELKDEITNKKYLTFCINDYFLIDKLEISFSKKNKFFDFFEKLLTKYDNYFKENYVSYYNDNYATMFNFINTKKEYASLNDSLLYAYALIKLKHFDKGITMYKNILRHSPDSITALYDYGLVLLKLYRDSEGIDLLSKAYKLERDKLNKQKIKNTIFYYSYLQGHSIGNLDD